MKILPPYGLHARLVLSQLGTGFIVCTDDVSNEAALPFRFSSFTFSSPLFDRGEPEVFPVVDSLVFAKAATAGMVALTFLLITFTSLLIKLFGGIKRVRLPPGPRGLPFIGIMHKVSIEPQRDFATLAEQYGPLVSFRLGQQLCMVASSPETAMEFLKNQDADFANRPHFHVADVVMTDDITFQDNTPLWRNLRRIFHTELTSPKRLEATQHLREEEVIHMLRSVPTDLVPVELNFIITVFATNVLSRTILNKRLGWTLAKDGENAESREVNDFKEIVEELFYCIGTFNLRDLFPILKWVDIQGLEPRYKKIKKRMDSVVMKIILEHQEQRVHNANLSKSKQDNDMVDFLLDQMELTDGNSISIENVKALIWDAFSGGTKTVVDTSTWAMTELVNNPEVMKKAHQELDTLIGRSRMIQESDVSSLPYIQAIVKETLRMHPAISLLVPHLAKSDSKAFGYDIPANTWVFFNVWAIGHDARIWKNPDQFDPDRFMVGSPYESIDFQGKHFELVPFGSGRRMCPGIGLASKMLHATVANMLHAFDWSLPPGLEDEKMKLPQCGKKGSKSVVFEAKLFTVVAKPRLASHLYPK